MKLNKTNWKACSVQNTNKKKTFSKKIRFGRKFHSCKKHFVELNVLKKTLLSFFTSE